MIDKIKQIESFLIEFLKKEFEKAEMKKAVIGLSGGVDSAVAAFLTAKALGRENLLGVMMPYKTSSESSVEDAKSVIGQLGIRSAFAPISNIVDEYVKLFGNDISSVRKGNIMARTRMIILYDFSAKENALVIGTGNKTEIYLGYSTLYGDSACAIDPLGDLYKTQVWELARVLGVPGNIIEKQPSADLWEGQTDEGELGFTYKQVDEYLYNKFDLGKNDYDLHKLGFDKEFIEKVNSRIEKYKFKSLPTVIPKITLS